MVASWTKPFRLTHAAFRCPCTAFVEPLAQGYFYSNPPLLFVLAPLTRGTNRAHWRRLQPQRHHHRHRRCLPIFQTCSNLWLLDITLFNILPVHPKCRPCITSLPRGQGRAESTTMGALGPYWVLWAKVNVFLPAMARINVAERKRESRNGEREKIEGQARSSIRPPSFSTASHVVAALVRSAATTVGKGYVKPLQWLQRAACRPSRFQWQYQDF